MLQLKAERALEGTDRPQSKTETWVERVAAPARLVSFIVGPATELPLGAVIASEPGSDSGGTSLRQHLRGVDLLLYQALCNLNRLRAGSTWEEAGGRGSVKAWAEKAAWRAHRAEFRAEQGMTGPS